MTAPLCPECSQPFTPTGKNQTFCTAEHKKHFYYIQHKRGQVVMPLLTAAREAGRYAGTDKELGAYARKEADALVSRWVVEDRAAKRSAAILVENKRKIGWRAPDLDMKAERRRRLRADSIRARAKSPDAARPLDTSE